MKKLISTSKIWGLMTPWTAGLCIAFSVFVCAKAATPTYGVDGVLIHATQKVAMGTVWSAIDTIAEHELRKDVPILEKRMDPDVLYKVKRSSRSAKELYRNYYDEASETQAGEFEELLNDFYVEEIVAMAEETGEGRRT